MRFVRKAGLANIAEVTRTYKEVELQLTIEDYQQIKKDSNYKIPELHNVISDNQVIITVVHAPHSHFRVEKKDINYLSLAELIGNFESWEMFTDIVRWMSRIYSGNYVQREAEVEEESDGEEEIKEVNNAAVIRKILFIIHAGSITGCMQQDGVDFDALLDEELSSQKYRMIEKLQRVLDECQNVDVAIENITPYISDGNVGSNTGYKDENIIMAKKLNELIPGNRFGTVVDFCHIEATKEILKYAGKAEESESFEMKAYFERFYGDAENKKLIRLFHLSKYDAESGEHGAVFSDTDQEEDLLDGIRQICFEYARPVPITLEVKGSEDSKKGAEAFDKIMIRWNKYHVLYKGKMEEELFDFFNCMYEVFSCEDYEDDDHFVENANKIKRYVMEHRTKWTRMYSEFSFEEDEINIPLFRIETYIQYIRYMNLLIDLSSQYAGTEKAFLTGLMKHYMFSDQYEEVKYDGLVFYYNICWKNETMFLYHMYDGFEGYQGTDGTTENIFSACIHHINNPDYHYSASKYFGRDLLKYFHYMPEKDSNNQELYNVEILCGEEVNFVETEGGLRITLQEYIDRQNEGEVKVQDYGIDFSAFLEGEADKKLILNKFCKDIKSSEIEHYVSPSYDGEVVFRRKPQNVKRYHLTIPELYLLIKAYQKIMREKKYDQQEKVITEITEKIREGSYSIETALIRLEKEYSGIASELITMENLKKLVDEELRMRKIKEILGRINYRQEEKINSSSEKYTNNKICQRPEVYYLGQVISVLKG